MTFAYLLQLARLSEYSVFYENQFRHGILFECKYNMHPHNMKCFRSVWNSIDLEVLVGLAKYAGSDVLYQLRIKIYIISHCIITLMISGKISDGGDAK